VRADEPALADDLGKALESILLSAHDRRS
jgi:hypothetical protein